MKCILINFLMLSAIITSAQIDTTQVFRFGFSFGGMISDQLLTKVEGSQTIGTQVGIFTRFEDSECRHWEAYLSILKSTFLIETTYSDVPLGLEKSQLRLGGERGLPFIGHTRLGVGLYGQYFYKAQKMITDLSGYTRFTGGVQTSFNFYPTEKIAVAVRYTQDVVNAFRNNETSTPKRGYDFHVAIVISATLF